MQLLSLVVPCYNEKDALFPFMEELEQILKWSFRKLVKYSIEGIASFTTMPLKLAALLGTLFIFIAVAVIIALAIRQYLYHNSVDGWTSLVCILFLLSGIQLFCMGIFGQYLAKMYMEIKRRPHYIISESSDNEK